MNCEKKDKKYTHTDKHNTELTHISSELITLVDRNHNTLLAMISNK